MYLRIEKSLNNTESSIAKNSISGLVVEILNDVDIFKKIYINYYKEKCGNNPKKRRAVIRSSFFVDLESKIVVYRLFQILLQPQSYQFVHEVLPHQEE